MPDYLYVTPIIVQYDGYKYPTLNFWSKSERKEHPDGGFEYKIYTWLDQPTHHYSTLSEMRIIKEFTPMPMFFRGVNPDIALFDEREAQYQAIVKEATEMSVPCNDFSLPYGYISSDGTFYGCTHGGHSHLESQIITLYDMPRGTDIEEEGFAVIRFPGLIRVALRQNMFNNMQLITLVKVFDTHYPQENIRFQIKQYMGIDFPPLSESE